VCLRLSACVPRRAQIFVEVERARLTRLLARIAEERGNPQEAAEIMQEVAVETYGALSKEEKVAFILEQVRLVLDRGDYTRAQILAKKVNPRTFVEREKKKEKEGKPVVDSSVAPPAEVRAASRRRCAAAHWLTHGRGCAPGHAVAGRAEADVLQPHDPLPPGAARSGSAHAGRSCASSGGALAPGAAALTPPRPLAALRQHANEYLEVCRCYQAVYEAPAVAADAARWQPALKRIALFVALAPRSPMQQSLLASTLADKRLAELPLHASLLKQLSTTEIIRWQALAAALEPELAAEADVFVGEAGAKRRADLALRVQEHNVHVVARYYSRISLARLAELLELPVAEAEARLSAMVSAKALAAKLDRPAGLIAFAGAGAGAAPDDMLNRWAASTEKLLGLVEVATHKIHKDATSHKVPVTAN
jgi:26S proteasome regulatory subunit N5